MMSIKRIYYAVVRRLLKLCNTFYYAFSDKSKILVINSMTYQLCNKFYNNNLGDDLNAVILGRLSGKRVLAYWSFYHFHPIDNLMAIGSIIDWMGNSSTIVWGAGILEPPLNQKSAEKKYTVGSICAVRGKKTRECLLKAGISCPEVYGDPALLLPLLYRPSVKTVKGRIGIIPHYADVDNSNVKRLLEELGENGILINVRGYRKWQDVIELICSCEFVISSSLHGLIISDAYGIPNRWVRFSDLLTGGVFKFEDYYSIYGKDIKPITINGQTHFQDIAQGDMPCREFVFDVNSLLKAYPFEIADPDICKLLS